MGTVRTATQYTRGSEVVSHTLAMLRASLARQTLLVLTVSVVVGLGSVLLEMGPERHALPAYLRAWFVEGLGEGLGEGLQLGAASDRAGHGRGAGELRRLAPLFGGRTVPFLSRQVAVRAAGVFVLGWPLLAAVLIAVGRALRADKFLRGAQLIDTTTPAYGRRHLRRALSHGALGAVAGAALVLVVVTRGQVVSSVRLGVAWLAQSWELVARWLSAEGDGARIWIHAAGQGGFASPERGYAVLSEAVGWGFAALVGVCLAGAAIGVVAGLAWAHRRRLAREPKDPDALSLGGVTIPREYEVSHILVSGVVRAGKSVAVKRMLDTVRDRSQRAIVWDRKNEYIERYYRPGRDIILNPFDARSACWTPWADADDMASCEALGKSLFPQDLAHDKFWAMGGALIFAWLVQRVGERLWGNTGRPMRQCPFNQELAYVLNHTEMAQLEQELKGSPAARYMSENATGMSQSFLGTLATNLSPFLYLRNLRPGEQAFSIRDFVQHGSPGAADAWLFISVDAKRFDAVRPLVSLWYDLAINAVLALPDNRGDVPIAKHRRIFAVLDELASLQVLPALDPALTVGASKGLSMMLGLQSLEQMKDTYGHHKAMTLLGQPQTRLVLRTVESTTAKWLEEELGKQEIERTTESQQIGADTQRDGVGLATQRRLESLVVYSEIQALPKLTGYLSLAGEPIKKIRYTWTAPRGDEPGLVPTGALPETTTPPPESGAEGARGREGAVRPPLPAASSQELQGRQRMAAVRARLLQSPDLSKDSGSLASGARPGEEPAVGDRSMAALGRARYADIAARRAKGKGDPASSRKTADKDPEAPTMHDPHNHDSVTSSTLARAESAITEGTDKGDADGEGNEALDFLRP